MRKPSRQFGLVLLGCVVVFALVGFVVGVAVKDLPGSSETVRGGSSIQPQYVESLSAWVYMPTLQTNEARIEIRTGNDLSLPATVVTGKVGDVIQYSGSITIEVVSIATVDSPPGSGSVIQIVRSGTDHRVLATIIGACAGGVLALVLWITKLRLAYTRPSSR